jgi:predicted anti-sigma-YlaC factor YlaD
LRLVAGMTGGETDAALAHLTDCPQCRAFFDRLGDVARVAQMETTHAESLSAAA